MKPKTNMKIKPIGKPKIKPILLADKFSQEWFNEMLNESKPFLVQFIKDQILEMEIVKQKYAETKKYVHSLEQRIIFLNKF